MTLRGYLEMADFARQKFVYLSMFTLVRRLGLAAAMTAFAFAPRAHAQGSYNRDVELASFDSAWTRVRDSYYDASMRGLDWVALRDSIRPQVERGRSRNDTRVAISALLSRLGESHFGILPGDSPDAAATTTPRPSGVAGDAGIEARFIDSLLVITRVDRGTPAQAMGIHAGWIIDEIDSLRVIDVLRSTSRVDAASRRFALVRLTLNLNNRLSGVAGETIRRVFRDASNVRREMQVSLRPTEGQLVEYAQLPPMHVRFDSDRRASGGGQCVGVIRFNLFMTPVMPRFEDAMASFNLCSGVILDLRGNLGGLGAMVMGISGHFFAEPETLGTIRMREAQMRYVANPVKVSRSGRPMQAFTGPVAVLVDDLSASTTEILASALQRLGRARVFGTPSAGQALPALLTKLPNGDRLMYVIGDYVGPGGTRLEGAGVVPDDLTPLSRDSLLAGKDDALQAAIRWIEIRARSASNSR